MTHHVHINRLTGVSEWRDAYQNETPALSAAELPLTCTDGSLVIAPDGQVIRATAEEQQIARAARVARAAVSKALSLPKRRTHHWMSQLRAPQRRINVYRPMISRCRLLPKSVLS